MSDLPQLLLLNDDAFRRLRELLSTLRPTDEVSGRFFHVTSSISNSALDNYILLKDAFLRNDQKNAAWACRNLLELAIYMDFVLLSKANADDFAADRLIDGKEISLSLRNLVLLHDNKELTSSLDETIVAFDSAIRDEGISRTKPKWTKKLASDLGMETEYAILNKICSKFVHPTAWSLLTADEGPMRFPEACEILLSSGGLYLYKIWAALKLHIKTFGLRDKD
jgi:hypothetical protein